MRRSYDGKRRECSCSPLDCKLDDLEGGGSAWAEVNFGTRVVKIHLESHKKLDLLRGLVAKTKGVTMQVFSSRPQRDLGD